MLAPGFGHVSVGVGGAGSPLEARQKRTAPAALLVRLRSRSEAKAQPRTPRTDRIGAGPASRFTSTGRVWIPGSLRAPGMTAARMVSSVLQRRRFAVPSPPAPPASGIGVGLPLFASSSSRASRAPRRGDRGVRGSRSGRRWERPGSVSPPPRQAAFRHGSLGSRSAFASLALVMTRAAVASPYFPVNEGEAKHPLLRHAFALSPARGRGWAAARGPSPRLHSSPSPK